MKKIIILFCLICIGHKAIAENTSQHPDESIQEALICPFIYNSVNVITGEYTEAQTDLSLSGSQPLKLRRCFTSQDLFNPGWHFNFPNILSTDSLDISEEIFSDKKIIYEYDQNGRIQLVKTTDPDGERIFNWMKFQYRLSDNPGCEIETFDGQHLIYGFDHSDKNKYGSQFLLKEVISNGKPLTSYRYRDHPINRTKLISQREEADGRYLINEYYEAGDNLVGNEIVKISESARDPYIGKVKLQKAPVGTDSQPITTHKYVYHEGYTEVWDALDNKTIYRYSKNKRLTAIEHYTKSVDGSDQFYRAERLYWDIQEVNDEPRLISKSYEDSLGNIVMCRAFMYDEKGNVSKDTLYGNLTGKNQAPLILEKGLPIENGVESYSTTYSYSDDDNNFLVKESEQNGKTIRYAYLPEKKLISAKYTCNGESIYTREFYIYDNEGLLIQTVQDDGNSEFLNDLSGVTERKIVSMALRKENPAYGEPSIIEEKCVDLTSGQEKLLKKLILHYTPQGKLSQQDYYDEEGSYCYSLLNEYDATGKIVKTKDAQGDIVEKIFDANGNLLCLCSKNLEGLEKKISYTYDFANRLIRSVEKDEKDNIASNSFRYDYAGNKVASMDSFGNETAFEYDSMGREIKIIHPMVLDENNNIISPTESREYDIFNRITVATNAQGYTTKTFYNIRGKPIQIVHPDGTQEIFEYNLDGSLSKSISRLGVTALYQNDFLKRITKVELISRKGNSLGITTAAYNAFHLIKETNSNGNSTFYTYDSAGRLIAIQKESDNDFQRIEYSYNTLGQLSEIKEWQSFDANTYIRTIIQRDHENNILEIRKEDSDGQIIKKETKEDINEANSEFNSLQVEEDQFLNDRGQYVLCISTTDVNGNTTITTMDALGRAEKIIKKNSFGLITVQKELRWDLEGNKIREIDTLISSNLPARQITTAWKYGPNNRIEEVIEALGSVDEKRIIYRYNEFGQLATIVKSNGISLFHEYNENGDLLRLSSSDGSIDYRYTYDQNHNIIKVEDLVNQAITERQYSSDHLVMESLGNGLKIQNGYDSANRRNELILPDSSSIIYCYNADRLKSINRLSPSGQKKYSHEYESYDSKGKILSANLIGNIGTINYSYDSKERIHSIQTPYWSETIPEDGYEVSNRLIRAETKDPLGQINHEWHYDDRHQLTNESGITESHFDYDSMGNRILLNGQSSSYNNLHQLTSNSHYQFAYDPNGNLIKKWNDQETIEYGYDALDRLIKVIFNNQKCVNFNYDAFHRCLTKTVSYKTNGHWKVENTTHFIYDGDHEIGTANNDGEITALRVLGQGLGAEIGAAVAIELDHTPYAPIHDHRGSVCCLVDLKNQASAEFYRYTAFGEEQIYDASANETSESSLKNPWRFSSKYYDSDIKLINYGKRFYDPSIGRWINKDPFGFIEGPNRYIYVKNDPVSLLDLYGLFSFSSYWQNFYTKSLAAYQKLSSLFNKADTYIKDNLSFASYIRPEVEKVAESMFSRGFLVLFGFYLDKPETGIYGKGEISDKIRVTLINGILNIRYDIIDNASMISNTHGGVNVHYVFRPTEGWTWDILKCTAVKFGYISPQARQLAETWKAMIKEMGGVGGGGIIYHYAHSIGGTDTCTAKSLLTPEEQKMIRVITLGSATIIQDDGFHSVVNYVSCRDGVCLLDPFGYLSGLTSFYANVVFLGNYWGIPFIDHPLCSQTYQAILEALGKEFIEKHIEN